MRSDEPNCATVLMVAYESQRYTRNIDTTAYDDVTGDVTMSSQERNVAVLTACHKDAYMYTHRQAESQTRTRTAGLLMDVTDVSQMT